MDQRQLERQFHHVRRRLLPGRFLLAVHRSGDAAGGRGSEIKQREANSIRKLHLAISLAVAPAALLVLFAAAARAGIVAADLRTGADGLGSGERFGGFADDVAGARAGAAAGRAGAAEGAGGLMHGLLRETAEELLEGHQA